MKKLKLLFISLCAILILIPNLLFNFNPDVISKIDNRKLAELPKFEYTDKYLKTVKDYYDDRYGLREEAIYHYTNLMDKAFGILVHPTYVYGLDGYIYFTMWNEEKYMPYHEKFVNAIDEIRNYVENKGAKFYMMINPEKKSVYPQYLPKGVNYNRKWIEAFEQKLAERQINFIDNTQELMERSQDEFVFDKKYDAGHWNDLGAFYGVNNLLTLINQDFPLVRQLSFDHFDITEETRTSLKVSTFDIDEKSPVFTLKYSDEYEDLTSNYADIKLDDNYPTFSYTQNHNIGANHLPKVLVFQGSYLNGREKYLMSRFSDYIAVHNYQNIFDIDYYFEKFNPDIVIFEVAEYTFSDMYFSEEKMEEMELE